MLTHLYTQCRHFTSLCVPACLPHCRQLLAGDVLTHFNGVPIADDGTFLFREAVRINFGHLVSQAFNGDVAMVSCAMLICGLWWCCCCGACRTLRCMVLRSAGVGRTQHVHGAGAYACQQHKHCSVAKAAVRQLSHRLSKHKPAASMPEHVLCTAVVLRCAAQGVA